MEQLIAGAKFPAKCVKNEIHNLLTTLRLTRGRTTVSGTQFHNRALRSFQRLFEDLTYIHELHEFDTVAYLGPFLEVIQSDATDGQITAVALGAIDKFVSFGLLHPESPRCMEAVNTLAWGVINCRFLSSGTANDEAVLLKIVGVLLDCLRCPAGEYLNDSCVWNMVRKCFQISRHTRASHILRFSAEGVLQQMILTIFGTHKARAHRVCVKQVPPGPSLVQEASEETGNRGGSPVSAQGGKSHAVQVYKPYGFKAMHFVLRFLAFLLAYGRAVPSAAEAKARARPRLTRSRSPSCNQSPRVTKGGAARDYSPEDNANSDLGLKDAPLTQSGEASCTETHCLGLSMLNVALESGGDEISKSDESIGVIQDEICKSLLQNSRTDSLSVLSLTLRAIFNLFLHFKKHLKVQLEIFFTSVHLKIAGAPDAPYEQREVALESLLEFCREPELMLEIYENYDSDVRYTNLFETLVKFLVTNSAPPDVDGNNARGANFNSLHRLALSGIASILHSMALRCEGRRHFREVENRTTADPEPQGGLPATAAETELQRKREQKRRVMLAVRAFNSEPSKSMSALQSLGLVANPPTPESMAEFLRHTPGLDIRLVGEYLSKRKDFNGQVRKAFMDLFPFSGLGIVEALRTLLGTFRLPGEAQLIERLMESFAEGYYVKQPTVMSTGGDEGEKSSSLDPLKTPRWVLREKLVHEDSADAPAADTGGGPIDGGCECNLRVRMSSSDTIFVLSYSIIMLNTDLHSAKVTKKMSVAEFIRNNRGIDGGKDMPEHFLTDIYEAILDEEIRLHGDTPAEGGDIQVDDFFWEGILRRSENIEEFSTTNRLLSEAPPGASERDMLQVIMDCSPMQTFAFCHECVADPAVVSEAMSGLQDLARLAAYFDQSDMVSGLVRAMCQNFLESSSLTTKSQTALRAAVQCIMQHHTSFKDEWRLVLDVLMQLWAFDMLPSHLTELDDFAGADGRPLESLCALRPPFPRPSEMDGAEPMHRDSRAMSNQEGNGRVEDRLSAPHADSTGDGFFESLTRWFEDETRDEDEISAERRQSGNEDMFGDMPLCGGKKNKSNDAAADELPVASTDPTVIHQAVKQFIAKSGFLDLFTSAGICRLPPESRMALTRALVSLSRPATWMSVAQSPTSNQVTKEPSQKPNAWYEVAAPVFGLEILTNLTCAPQCSGHGLSQIWPSVSTHFERLLQYVVSGGGGDENQFIERLIVNTLRLCIRLIDNSELVPTLLALTQQLSRLPPNLFSAYSERVACGLLVLVKETNLPHSGLCAIFALLRRISDFPGGTGACNAGLECVNHWLSDDAELTRLLAMQQFPELLSTLKAFASQNSTAASTTALRHLSSLVPQMARGARNLSQDTRHWQSLWVPTLHALADIAKNGAQRSSAEAFVYLQRLLLERDTELSLPWEEVEFSVWKECLEQVLFPLLQTPAAAGEPTSSDVDCSRNASAAQLICRVVLTHMPDWLRTSTEGFAVLFLRLLHILVSETANPGHSHEPLVESLKNLLLVISADPLFMELESPNRGGSLLEGAWGVVSPGFPDLRQEITAILRPDVDFA